MKKLMQLENLVKLSSKVSIIVPSTYDVDKAIDSTAYVDAILTALSDMFGGATASDTLGCWLSPTAGLVKEKSVTVFAYCHEKDLADNIGAIIEKCEWLKSEMKQEAIAMEVNGEMYFI